METPPKNPAEPPGIPPDPRLDYPSADRNRGVIVDVLKRVLPSLGTGSESVKSATVLEIASGSGQHVAAFAGAMPGLRWQPCDLDTGLFASIDAWVRHENVGGRVNPPLAIDATAPVWPTGVIDSIDGIDNLIAVLAINMIHIAPWAACLGTLKNAGRLLPPGGIVYLYGPYKIGGRHTAPSNDAFDRSLRQRNPEWGVRNLDDVAAAALDEGFQLAETVQMPANNLSVIFKRKG